MSSKALFVALLVGIAAPLSAQTTYFGADPNVNTLTNSGPASAQWFASMSVTGTETFETTAFSNPNQPLNFGGLGTGNLADPVFFGGFNDISGILAVPALGGLAYKTAFGGLVPAPMTISFAASNGFSLWATGLNDVGEGQPSIVLDFFAGQNLLFHWVVDDPSTATFNTMFLGVSGLNGLTSVNMYGESGDGVGFDNISIGKADLNGVVPEPATMMLVATGLVGMIGARRRKRA